MLIAEIIPSHKVAQWLLVHIHRLLDIVGLEKDKMTEEIIYVAIIVVTAMLLGWLLSYAIRLLIRKIVDVRSPQLATDLKEKHVRFLVLRSLSNLSHANDSTEHMAIHTVTDV